MGNWTELIIESAKTGEQLFFVEGGKCISFNSDDYADFAIGVIAGKGISEDVNVFFKDDYSADDCLLQISDFEKSLVNLLTGEIILMPNDLYDDDRLFWEGIEAADNKHMNGIFCQIGYEDNFFGWVFISCETTKTDSSSAASVFKAFTDNDAIIELATTGLEANIRLAMQLLNAEKV